MPVPGDYEEDTLLGAQDQPGLGTDAISRDDDMNAFGRLHIQPAITCHGLNVVAPDTGGVDHPPTSDPNVAAVFEVSRLDPGDAALLEDQRASPHTAGEKGTVRGGSPGQHQGVAGIVDHRIPVPDRPHHVASGECRCHLECGLSTEMRVAG